MKKIERLLDKIYVAVNTVDILNLMIYIQKLIDVVGYEKATELLEQTQYGLIPLNGSKCFFR